MARISGTNTKPEILVRDLIKAKGFRIKSHVRTLPGNPDIALVRRKKAVFVHGCFWHGHKGCKRAKRPSTNSAFWNKKINGNIERDMRNLKELKNMGWTPLVIWQCQTKNFERLKNRLDRALNLGRRQL